MRFGFAHLWLLLCPLSGLAGCSFPEAAAASGNGKAPSSPHDHEIAREQSAVDRRGLQQQNEILSDLQKLRKGRREGPTELANDDASDPKQPKLLIFGGASHEVYLGCLCDGRNPESVFNLAGEYGSARSTTSMRNKRTPYGSRHEDTSACNAHARHPPSVVASDGKALGLLTVNGSLKKRIAARSVTDWLSRLCRL